jgi:hypothetical protein
MTFLSKYRHRVRELLTSPDVEAQLVSEGVRPALAARVAGSRAVIATRSFDAAKERVERESNKRKAADCQE